jgi:hypothetical protein
MIEQSASQANKKKKNPEAAKRLAFHQGRYDDSTLL